MVQAPTCFWLRIKIEVIVQALFGGGITINRMIMTSWSTKNLSVN